MPLPFHRSIRHRFVLLTAVPVAILFIMLQIFITRADLRVTVESLETEMLLDAQSIAVGITSEFRSTGNLARFNASLMSEFEGVSAENVQRLIRTTVASTPQVFGAAVAWEPGAFDGKNGPYAPYSYRADDEVHSLDIGDPDPAVGYNYLESPWYTTPKASGRAAWSAPYYDEGAGNVLMTTFSAPFQRNGRFAGVATIDLELRDLFQGLPVTPIGYGAIIDAQGNFIYHWRTNLILTDRVTSLTDYFELTDLESLLQRVVTEERGFARIKRKDTDDVIWVAFLPIDPDGTFYIESRYEDEVMAVARHKIKLAILSELASLLVVLGVVWWLSGRMASPILKLSNAARRIAAGERSVHVEVKDKNEIGTLAETFNQMAEVVGLREDEMQAAVRQRTAELEQSNRQVEAQKSELENKVSELKIARDRAEEANQAKSALLAVATHDLKNPISAIVGMSDIMLDLKKAEPSPQAQEDIEILSTIHESAQHLSDVVKGILANEGLEAHGIDLKQTIDLRAKCHDVMKFNAANANRKGTTIHHEIDENTALLITGDATRIREAMDNYLSNAIKYSPPGSRVIVRLYMQPENHHARFAVSDNGPGLHPDDHAKLFGKFQKLSAQPTGGESSTGLGLSIVKSIVEMHGGRVGCDSAPGHGATFWFEVPLLPAAAPETGAPQDDTAGH